MVLCILQNYTHIPTHNVLHVQCAYTLYTFWSGSHGGESPTQQPMIGLTQYLFVLHRNHRNCNVLQENDRRWRNMSILDNANADMGSRVARRLSLRRCDKVWHLWKMRVWPVLSLSPRSGYSRPDWGHSGPYGEDIWINKTKKLNALFTLATVILNHNVTGAPFLCHICVSIDRRRCCLCKVFCHWLRPSWRRYTHKTSPCAVQWRGINNTPK